MLAAPDMATEGAVRTKTLCDKWVSAINQQLRLKVESQTEKLEERIRELEEKLKEKEK
jgi:type II secretory pathway predicted ATPase ExeA